MFINQNQLVRELQCISRIHVRVAGKTASPHDRLQFQTVTILRYGLEADLSGISSFPVCVYRRVIHGLSSIDLRDYASDMKYVKLAYIREWCDHQEFSWHDFKRRVADKIRNKWILVVLAKVSNSFKDGLQWLSFDERLLLNTNEDDISDEISSYIEFERQLVDTHCPDDVVSLLRPIISDFLKDLSLGLKAPRPKFGPGAVAEVGGRKPAVEKVVNLVYDSSTSEKLCSLFGCETDDLFVGHAGKACFTNRIIFRPKNALSHRIISAEPTWLTWVQQALKDVLFDYVERNPKMFTWFSDQSTSRRMALRGSSDGSFATIDFSSASDSVTTELVGSLFRDTYVGDALLCTRSLYAELPDGQVISLRKFAPMGSATCFVTMDIILLSVCEASIRLSLGRGGRRGDYTVYGDDVVIRSEAVSVFDELSQAIGMTVNTAKSYSDVQTPHFYREACGVEAFDGVDVTPIRYSRFQEPLLRNGPVEPEWWAQSIDLINGLLLRHYFINARSAAIELIKCSIGRAENPHKRRLSQSIWDHLLRIDCSDYLSGYDGPIAVVVPDGTATNYRCKFGRSEKFQSPYVTVRCPVAREIDPHSIDRETELFDYWHFRAQAGSLDSRESKGSLLSSAAGSLPLRWGWVRHTLG